MTRTGAHLKIARMGDAVQGVELFGDVRRPEPDSFRVAFPGGDVDVSRTSDGSYWVHVRVNHPAHPNGVSEGEIPGRLVDARLDVVDKHASDTNAGDFANPGLYHLAVRIARVVAPVPAAAPPPEPPPPEPPPPAAPAAPDVPPALPATPTPEGGWDRNPAIEAIRVALRKRSGKAWSVKGGRGTSWGWITIVAPPARCTWRYENVPYVDAAHPGGAMWVDTGQPGGAMGPAECAELGRLLGIDGPVNHQGESVPASSAHRAEYVARAEGRPATKTPPYWD